MTSFGFIHNFNHLFKKTNQHITTVLTIIVVISQYSMTLMAILVVAY